jgi:acyl dehydratase
VLCVTAAGAGSFAHVIGDALVAFIEQSSKFLKPVYPGDTLYPALTVASLVPQRTTGVVTLAVTVHNQRNELVMSGEQKYLLRKRRQAMADASGAG